jgi:hypothetical protein
MSHRVHFGRTSAATRGQAYGLYTAVYERGVFLWHDQGYIKLLGQSLLRQQRWIGFRGAFLAVM